MRQTSQGQALRLNNPAGLTKSVGEPLGSHVELAGGELLVFDKPSYGIRALAVELQKLEQEQGKAVLGDVVRRWAAFKGADPERYFDAVAKHIAEPDRVLDLTSHADLRAAVETVIRSELGRMPYSDAQLVKGLVLAGIEPARRPLDHSRTLRAGITGHAASRRLPSWPRSCAPNRTGPKLWCATLCLRCCRRSSRCKRI